VTEKPTNLLTQSEASTVAAVPIKAVYKTVAERLPKSSLVRRSGQILLTLQGVVCVRLDYDLPKEVPVKVRRFVYGKLNEGGTDGAAYGAIGTTVSEIFSYTIDPGPAAKKVAESLRDYRRAMELIVEDPEIQGGAATFKGTRLSVHTIGSLLQQGVSEQELRADYPHLTPEMIAAARLYIQANPRLGRPRKPAWHGVAPLSTRLTQRHRA
jgi:uncharacterized protein (DUF433 family)